MSTFVRDFDYQLEGGREVQHNGSSCILNFSLTSFSTIIFSFEKHESKSLLISSFSIHLPLGNQHLHQSGTKEAMKLFFFIALTIIFIKVEFTKGSLATGSSFNSPLKSTSRKILHYSHSVNNMAANRDKGNGDSSPSVLRELKETIQKQAKEIERLRSEIATTKKSSKSSSDSSSHGHGPPVADEDPNIYIKTPFYMLAFKRVGWLFIFLMSLSLTAIIMNGFEHIISKQIELAYFVPLLAGHGGNTGGQTVGSVLSALSTNAITTKDAFSTIRKEAMSGLTVGLILGSIIGLLSYHVGGISLHVSTVVFCTLPLLSTIAATLASTIPFLCKMVGLDPAIIAAPAMTTFVDVTGLMSYFLIANKIFSLFGLEL